MEPKNSSPVTYPNIFRLRDQIHKYTIFPIRFLMKDVLQLTTATVMASSAKIKNMTPKVKNI